MPDSSITKTIIISATVVIVAIIIYLIVWQNKPHRLDEQEKITCGPKTVFRYKYPSEAYPIFARDYNTEVSLTTDVLKRITDSVGKTEIGVEAKNKVIELQDKLDQDNITFSTALRTYFLNVNSDPCNDSLRQQFLAFTNEMSRRMLELRSATAQVTTITQKGTSAKPAEDTSIVRPAYAIIKDSMAIRKSILKLDELLQDNKGFNNMVRIMPAPKL